MFSQLYKSIALLGMQTRRRCKRLFKWLFSVVKKPFFAVMALFHVIFTALDHFTFRTARNASQDFRRLKAEVSASVITLRNLIKNAPFKAPSALFAYTRKAVRTHRTVFTYTLNTVLPVLAAVIMLLTINYWATRNFALKVTRGETVIGCVKSEAALKSASKQALASLNTGLNLAHSEDILSDVSYAVECVSPDEISDAATVRNELIKQSDGNVISACGIYIDGSFICALKSELSAMGVFENIISSYIPVHDNSRVAFVENFEYVQGYYPNDENVIWDTATLSQKLKSTKNSAVSYTVKSGDTISKIANLFGMTTAQIYSANPELKKTSLSVGTVISLSSDVSYVRVKEVQTVTALEEVPYEIIKTETPSLFKGSSRVKTKGINGEANVTRLVTYIGDNAVSSVEVARTVTKEPVSQVTEVGTLTLSRVPDNYTVTHTNGRFCWPAAKAKTITSSYGYRSLGFHSAIDISCSGAAGTLVLAADAGTVTYSGWRDDGGGYCVIIKHSDGLSTFYAHMKENSLMVRTGQKVSKGQAIGRIGSTGYAFGAHLHFEVRLNGNSVNPLPYLGLG